MQRNRVNKVNLPEEDQIDSIDQENNENIKKKELIRGISYFYLIILYLYI